MKIRTGFVSNSSTSSFCIYGSHIDGDNYDEEFYEKVENLGLECYENERSGGYFVGLSPVNLQDDETGLQFKERIKALLKQLVGDEVPLNIKFIQSE
jgi:hypothetical protein